MRAVPCISLIKVDIIPILFTANHLVQAQTAGENLATPWSAPPDWRRLTASRSTAGSILLLILSLAVLLQSFNSPSISFPSTRAVKHLVRTISLYISIGGMEGLCLHKDWYSDIWPCSPYSICACACACACVCVCVCVCLVCTLAVHVQCVCVCVCVCACACIAWPFMPP